VYGYANCANYPPVLKRRELYFSQAIIWVKEQPVLTRKDFMRVALLRLARGCGPQVLRTK
jgi:hypothetical protein